MKRFLFTSCIIIGCLFSQLTAFGQDNEPRYCDKNITFSGITLQSYMVGTSYNGGLRKIKQHFFDNYKRPTNNRQTGYCTLRFLVNCDGNISDIETLSCTIDFKKLTFSSDVTEQLIDLLYKLGKWNPGMIKEVERLVVSQKYLTFIINEGNLVDIVPK